MTRRVQLQAQITERLADQVAPPEPDEATTGVKGSIELRMVRKRLSDGTIKVYGPYKYRNVWRSGHLTSEYLGKATEGERAPRTAKKR